MLSEVLPVVWHPLGQCTAASANHVVAAHEIARCKSYNLWSGIVGDVTIATSVIAAVSVFWHKHNCHEHRCLRLSWHPNEAGHPICKVHHQDHSRRSLGWEVKHFLATGHFGDHDHPNHRRNDAHD